MLRTFLVFTLLGIVGCASREIASLPPVYQELEKGPTAQEEICKSVAEKDKSQWERFQKSGTSTSGLAIIGTPTGALPFLREILDKENIQGDFAVECEDSFFAFLPLKKKSAELQKKILEKFKTKATLFRIEEMLEFTPKLYTNWIEEECKNLETCKEKLVDVPAPISCELVLFHNYRLLPKNMQRLERLAKCTSLTSDEWACLIHNPQNEEETECRDEALKKFE